MNIKKAFKRNRMLCLLILPVLLIYIVFSCIPMGGIIIAFKDCKPALGIWGSPWTSEIGLKHFIDFFQAPVFGRLIKNTLTLSLGTPIAGLPAPIILASAAGSVSTNLYYKPCLAEDWLGEHYLHCGNRRCGWSAL